MQQCFFVKRGKPVHCESHSSPTFPSGIMSLLKCGDLLRNGQMLRSGNGRFTLCMQKDGNLVVYSGSTPIWASRTDSKGCQPFRLVMQEDSNLCIYDGTGRCTWASNTWRAGHAGAWVTMQDDGNMVLYDGNGKSRALWCTRTDGGQRAPEHYHGKGHKM